MGFARCDQQFARGVWYRRIIQSHQVLRLVHYPVLQLWLYLPKEHQRVQHRNRLLTLPAPRGQATPMIRRLYDRTLSLVDHPHALWALAFIAFIESSVFPIPPDVLMIPMILAAPHRAWLIAGTALCASVLGGLLGYAIGALAFEQVGLPILTTLGKADAVAAFNARFNDVGFWAVLTAGVTPFPYKVITIMSGWTAMPIGTFIATSILARGLRFFVVAGLLWHFGAPIREFIEKRLGLMFTLFILILLGGFAAVSLI